MTPDDDRIAQLHEAHDGRAFGRADLWRDDTITGWYRRERGLTAECDVGDSGRDGNGP
jgi:hypothetical protein